jgi:hypothetical protein
MWRRSWCPWGPVVKRRARRHNPVTGKIPAFKNGCYRRWGREKRAHITRSWSNYRLLSALQLETSNFRNPGSKLPNEVINIFVGSIKRSLLLRSGNVTSRIRPGRPQFDSRPRIFSTASRPALGLPLPPIQSLPGFFRHGHKAEHTQSNANVKNTWSHTAIPLTFSRLGT